MGAGEGAQGPGTTLRGAPMHEKLGKVHEERVEGSAVRGCSIEERNPEHPPPPRALFTV